MRLTAKEVAKLVDGKVHGDELAVVDRAAPIRQAGPSTLTYAANEFNFRRLPDSEAVVVLLDEADQEKAKVPQSATVITVAVDVELAFLEVAKVLHPPRAVREIGVSPAATVAASAVIGTGSNIHPHVTIAEDVVIGTGCTVLPGCSIGRGVTLGSNVVLHPNVVIYDDVSIGNNCTVHANAVVGADGFGYRFVDGRHQLIPHLGTVRIEDDVEIGACTTIDRAKVGETVIGRGTKLDNQVMIGHNCDIGEHNLIVSQVGLAGSVSTGSYVVIAGQVGVADHVHLGDRAIFGAKCGVTRDMPGGQTYLGAPAAPASEMRRQLMALRKLPDLRKTIRGMEKELAALKASAGPALMRADMVSPSQNASGKAA